MTKPRRFTAVAHMWCEIRLGILDDSAKGYFANGHVRTFAEG